MKNDGMNDPNSRIRERLAASEKVVLSLMQDILLLNSRIESAKQEIEKIKNTLEVIGYEKEVV